MAPYRQRNKRWNVQIGKSEYPLMNGILASKYYLTDTLVHALSASNPFRKFWIVFEAKLSENPENLIMLT